MSILVTGAGLIGRLTAGLLAVLAAGARGRAVPGDPFMLWGGREEFIKLPGSAPPRLAASVPPDSGKGFAVVPHVRPAPSDVSAAGWDLGLRYGFGRRETMAYATGAS